MAEFLNQDEIGTLLDIVDEVPTTNADKKGLIVQLEKNGLTKQEEKDIIIDLCTRYKGKVTILNTDLVNR